MRLRLISEIDSLNGPNLQSQITSATGIDLDKSTQDQLQSQQNFENQLARQRQKVIKPQLRNIDRSVHQMDNELTNLKTNNDRASTSGKTVDQQLQRLSVMLTNLSKSI